MGKLVSCLCVSKPDRWGLLQRAVLDFGRQTLPDRELIVAVTDSRYAEQIEEFATNRAIPGVRVVQRDQRDQGGLLLHAQAAARGDFLAAWDDDNLNAPDRLADQTATMDGTAVSVLGGALYFFYDTSELFVANFEQPNVPPSLRSAASSLIVPRHLMPAWPLGNRNNSCVATLLDSFARQKIRLAVVAGFNGNHLVGVRGDNLRGYEYHRKLAASPLTMSAETLARNKASVEAMLERYVWPGQVAVCGPDGKAFDYLPSRRWSAEGNLFPVGDPKDGVHRTTEKV